MRGLRPQSMGRGVYFEIGVALIRSSENFSKTEGAAVQIGQAGDNFSGRQKERCLLYFGFKECPKASFRNEGGGGVCQ